MFPTYKTRDANKILQSLRKGWILRIEELDEKPSNYNSLREAPFHEDAFNPGDKIIIQPRGTSDVYWFARVLQ